MKLECSNAKLDEKWGDGRMRREKRTRSKGRKPGDQASPVQIALGVLEISMFLFPKYREGMSHGGFYELFQRKVRNFFLQMQFLKLA